jgi:flagellar biosynthetic protein FliR
MISFTEAQILGWVTPVLWPFMRVLAMLQILPVLGQRNVPARLKVALAFLVALCAAGVAPPIEPVPLDSALAMLLVVQQLLIGLSIGFAVRIVFAAVEFAGEVAGLQMGMNFAGFFDPVLASESTAASRFFASLIGLLFVVSNGHLRVIEAVVQSLVAFPVSAEPFAFLRAMAPQTWGAQVFQPGAVDGPADDRRAAVRQLGAGHHFARGTAGEHFFARLPGDPGRRPAHHDGHAAADGVTLPRHAGAHAFGLWRLSAPGPALHSIERSR